MTEKLLPIVPGCRALVVRVAKWAHILTGTEVTVINAARGYPEPYWTIDSALCRQLCTDKYADPSIPERYLLRIDGNSFAHEKDSYELPLERTT